MPLVSFLFLFPSLQGYLGVVLATLSPAAPEAIAGAEVGGCCLKMVAKVSNPTASALSGHGKWESGFFPLFLPSFSHLQMS